MKEAHLRTQTANKSALSIPVFRRYLPSSGLSTFAAWVVRFLLGWSAWEMTHSAFWVGVIAGISLAPTILLSPVFGIVSDRIDPRNGLIVTVFLQAVVAGIGALASMFGGYSLTLLICLAGLSGLVTAAHTPIRLALIPLLVSRDALPNAVGYSAIIFNTSRILAPAAAAWFVTQTSVANAFLVASMLQAAALPFLASVKVIRDRAPQEASSLVKQFAAGLRYVQHHAGIRLVFAYAALNALLGRTVIELLPALSGQLLNGDAAILATLTAFAGVGSILAGAIMSRQTSDESKMLSLLTFSFVIGSASLVTLAYFDSLIVLCAVTISISMVTTIVGTGTQILTQLLVEDGYRGRVLSLWTVLAMGGAAFGVLVMGGLADLLGFSRVLPAFSVLSIVAVMLLYRQRKSVVSSKDELKG